MGTTAELLLRTHSPLEEAPVSLSCLSLLEEVDNRQGQRSLIIRSSCDRNPIRKNSSKDQTFRTVSTEFKFAREPIKPCKKEMPDQEGALQTLM